MNIQLLPCALACFVLLLPAGLRSGEMTAPECRGGPRTVRLTDATAHAPLEPHVEYLEDAGASLALSDVCADGSHASFIHSGRSLSFGLTRSAYWVRFNLEYSSKLRPRGEWILEIGYPLLDDITVYLIDGGGSVTVRRSGDSIPYHLREVEYHDHLVVLDLARGERYTVYLRAASGGSVDIPLDIWSHKGFIEKSKDERLLYGIYAGILLAMAFFNLAIFIIIRDANYLLYLAYMIMVGFAVGVLNGIVNEYFFPDLLWLSRNAVPVTGSIALFLGILFSRNFLNLREHAPRMDCLFLAMAVLSASPLVLAALGRYSLGIYAYSLLMMMFPPLVISASVLCLKKGYRPARYFLIAWSMFLTGAAIYASKNFTLLPYTFFTKNVVYFGSGFEFLFLSIALLDRFNILRRERDAMEQELDIARKIQEATVPRRLPEMPGARISVLYRPMEKVGGDFYDFHVMDGRRLGVLITDVSGHGIPAALITSMIKVAFCTVMDEGRRPAALLAGMSGVLSGNLEEQFITAGYACIDLEEGRIEYARAGHEPLIVCRAGERTVHEVRPGGRAIGIQADCRLDTGSIGIAGGDRVILYTDCVIEAADPRGAMFGREAFYGLIRDGMDLSADAFSRSLVDRLAAWTGIRNTDGFEDDLTLLVIDIL